MSAELLKIAESVAKAAGSHLMKRPATFTFTEKSSAVDFATQMGDVHRISKSHDNVSYMCIKYDECESFVTKQCHKYDIQGD